MKTTIKNISNIRALRIRDRSGLESMPGAAPDGHTAPPDQGDVLYLLAKRASDAGALEVGFATGSTASYLLMGLATSSLTSIDYAQDDYDREGLKLIADLGLEKRHRLIEGNSIGVLPELHKKGCRFSLIFMDGWKTFDHMWVDVFFAAKMLEVGGHIAFDDARMPAVRKCISLLRVYYGFRPVDCYMAVGGFRRRLWHLMTTRSVHKPYVVLQKKSEIDQTAAGKR